MTLCNSLYQYFRTKCCFSLNSSLKKSSPILKRSILNFTRGSSLSSFHRCVCASVLWSGFIRRTSWGCISATYCSSCLLTGAGSALSMQSLLKDRPDVFCNVPVSCTFVNTTVGWAGGVKVYSLRFLKRKYCSIFFMSMSSLCVCSSISSTKA